MNKHPDSPSSLGLEPGLAGHPTPHGDPSPVAEGVLPPYSVRGQHTLCRETIASRILEAMTEPGTRVSATPGRVTRPDWSSAALWITVRPPGFSAALGFSLGTLGWCAYLTGIDGAPRGAPLGEDVEWREGLCRKLALNILSNICPVSPIAKRGDSDAPALGASPSYSDLSHFQRLEIRARRLAMQLGRDNYYLCRDRLAYWNGHPKMQGDWLARLNVARGAYRRSAARLHALLYQHGLTAVVPKWSY